MATRLRKGDTIGVISPSAPITPLTHRQLTRGVKFLERLDFQIILGRNALRKEEYSAGSSEDRAADINAMFADKEVKAVICSQGGETANSCLPFVDWKLVRKNPKIFLGISDITVLLNALYSQTGLVTFHGNDVVWGFGRNPTEYERQAFIDRLMRGRLGRVSKNSEWKTLRDGVAEGRLLGGNVGSLLRLAGTRYFPDFDESILFVEAFNPTPAACDSMFAQLEQMGLFDQVRGVLVGYIYGLQAPKKNLTQMEEVLFKITKEYDFPIVKTNDFGHQSPNTILPVGSRVRLDAQKRQMELLEEYVV